MGLTAFLSEHVKGYVVMAFRVACAQMNVALGDKKTNLETAVQMIKEAANREVDLIVLPELFTTGYCLDKAGVLAESSQGHTMELLRDLAGRFRIFIVAGSILEKRDSQIFNTCHLIGKDGKLLGHYDKIHLFPPFREDHYLSAGTDTPIIKTELGLFGVMICFDIRFPELAGKLAYNGAQVLFCPAEFPAERIAVWATLIRARAIENQVFVIGCNRVGSDGKNLFGGRSAIINPEGHTLAQANNGHQLIDAMINLDEIIAVRKSLPVMNFRHKKY
ncbi:MAG: carbon-nitrogen family hydrolase [Promethearchaeota archaeon]